MKLVEIYLSSILLKFDIYIQFSLPKEFFHQLFMIMGNNYVFSAFFNT